MKPLFEIVPERPGDDPAIESIHEMTFGPGRYARTAFRIRESASQGPVLAFIALHDGRVVGSVRLSAVMIGESAALLLGPLAVHPLLAGRGAGSALMRAGLETARASGHKLVVLVGDRAYYERFGFRPVEPGRIVFPGPVDPARVQIAELAPNAFEGIAGPIAARREDSFNALRATKPKKWPRAARRAR